MKKILLITLILGIKLMQGQNLSKDNIKEKLFNLTNQKENLFGSELIFFYNFDCVNNIMNNQNKLQSHKTDALKQRLVHKRILRLSSGEYLKNDSTNYSYSSNRGNGNYENLLFLYNPEDYDINERIITESNEWKYLQKITKTYDSDGRTISKQYNDYNGILWQKNIKEDIEYNSLGQLTVFTSSYWDTILLSWIPLTRKLYEYNTLGNSTIVIYQNFDNISSSWSSSERTSITYNSFNLPIEILYESFISGLWVNESKIIYLYDSDNNIISVIFNLWNLGTWENEIKYDYTYNITNTLESSIYSLWISGTWKFQNKQTTLYNLNSYPNNITYQSWDTISSNWINTNKTLYYYSSSDLVEEIILQEWLSGSWNNNIKYSNILYNAFGNIIEYKYYLVNSGIWNEFFKYNLYYETFEDATSTNDINIDPIKSNIFPNPIIANTMLSFELKKPISLNLSILDINGKEINRISLYGHEGNNNILLDLSEYSNGMYIYKIQGDGISSVGKLIKE